MAVDRSRVARWVPEGVVLTDDAALVMAVLVEAGETRQVLEVEMTPPDIARRAELDQSRVDAALILLQPRAGVRGEIEAIGPHKWRMYGGPVMETPQPAAHKPAPEPPVPASRATPGPAPASAPRTVPAGSPPLTGPARPAPVPAQLPSPPRAPGA